MTKEEKKDVSELIKQIKENGTKVLPGFAVRDAPLWLFEELRKEANEYYAGRYWPVLVDWYRKAKEYEYIMRGGLPEETRNVEQVSQAPVVEEKVVKNKRPALFGSE